jgi:hypothetical protein
MADAMVRSTAAPGVVAMMMMVTSRIRVELRAAVSASRPACRSGGIDRAGGRGKLRQAAGLAAYRATDMPAVASFPFSRTCNTRGKMTIT